MDFQKSFEEIREDRMGVVGSSVYPGLKALVSQIYPDEAHFIYELLQNAEDACATEVEFSIKKTKLVFAHNGTKLFDAADINAITNIANSTKKDNYVQAGKFGIGFKSVYAFTDTPSIYCDTVSFKIEKLLLPTEIEPLKSKKEGWTEFHFPFNSKKIEPEKAKKVITQGLKEIENTTLLFLNNIGKISYKLEDGSESVVEKTVEGNFVTSTLYDGKKIKSVNYWKRFTRNASLHGKKISVDIAFAMEERKEGGYKFVAGQNKVSITFIAKNEKSNLKFYINAPFGCPPTRDTVNKGDEDNQALIQEVAKLIKDVLDTLKSEDMLTDEFFNILPISDDEIQPFYSPLVEAMCELFRERAYLPTVKGGYVTVENGVMSSRNVIDNIFTIGDIQQLYGNKKLQFVKNRPLNTRGYRFLKLLNIEEVTPVGILDQMCKMDSDALNKWIKKLDIKQLAEVYSFLHKGLLDLQHDFEKNEAYASYINYKDSAEYQDEYHNALKYNEAIRRIVAIGKLQIIKGVDGKFYKPSDIRILSKNVPAPAGIKVVDKKLTDKKDSLAFLKLVGVKEFAERDLEEFKQNKDASDFLKKMDNLSENDSPIKVARMIIAYLTDHDMKEVDLSKYKFVCAIPADANGNKRIFASPAECFLDTPYVDETGFRYAIDIHKKLAISDVYKRLESTELARWLNILKYYGCYYQLEIEEAVINTGHKTGYHYDYRVNYLRRFLEKMNPALCHYVWRFFTTTGNWQEYYAFETKKINQRYDEEISDSSIIKILKGSKWILNKKGELCEPEAVSVDTLEHSWLLPKNREFLDAIGFGKQQQQREEERRKRDELKRLKQEERLEAAKSLGFADAEAVVRAKENSKIISELAELGVDIQEILNSKKKERNRKKFSISDQLKDMKNNKFIAKEYSDDGEVYAVKNPERRASKLIDGMEEEGSPETKNVIVKRTVANFAERQFVGNEYSGKCQICDKIIYKRDGSRYFTAINLLDTGHLEEEYLKGMSTGWNTLCLCPNCAAEFRYGAVSLNDFVAKVKKVQIESDYEDYYTFDIEMQGQVKKIKYTPKHLLALKTAFLYFSKHKDIDVVED